MYRYHNMSSYIEKKSNSKKISDSFLMMEGYVSISWHVILHLKINLTVKKLVIFSDQFPPHILKMETPVWVHIYQTVWNYIPEDYNLNIHHDKSPWSKIPVF
jgi:hypothetical protein